MIPTRWRSTNPAEHRSSIAASYPCILTFASSKGCVELPGGGGPTCSTAMPLFARGCAKYTDRPGPSVGLIEPRPYSVKSSRLPQTRSEEHTSELQSLMRISYAVFCLKKNKYK